MWKTNMMNKGHNVDWFLTRLGPEDKSTISYLYSGEYGPDTPKTICEAFNTAPVSECNVTCPLCDYGGGGGSGGCQCDSNKDKSGVTDIAYANIINFYKGLNNQTNFDQLITLFIDNYSVFEDVYDEQVEFRGIINKGGVKVETGESPENRISGEETPVVYENYSDFNAKLQIAIDEFAPIINREFNCNCLESYTYIDERQINILFDLIYEVKQLPVSNELIMELNKVENYLQTREDNSFKTDILNYLNY